MQKDISDDEIIESPDDEMVLEDTEDGTIESQAKDKIKKVKDRVKELEGEKAEYLLNWQKERADFLNYKKDEAERMKRTREVTTERFAEELLPVLDSYDMAFSNREAWEKVDQNWRMGVEYIHQQLLKILAENGISAIETKIGDAFDPMLHQPIETIETDDESKDHTIAAVTQTGYKMGEKILRPSRVNLFEYK